MRECGARCSGSRTFSALIGVSIGSRSRWRSDDGNLRSKGSWRDRYRTNAKIDRRGAQFATTLRSNCSRSRQFRDRTRGPLILFFFFFPKRAIVAFSFFVNELTVEIVLPYILSPSARLSAPSIE